MSRFLFVVPPMAGHINPAIGVARELDARGHTVAFAGDRRTLDRLLPTWMQRYACELPPWGSRPAELRGYAALKFLWEQVLLPLAEVMVPGVRAAVRAFRPHVLVVDQQALAGAVVAQQLGIPWVTSATTSSELIDPLAGTPKIKSWLATLLSELRKRHDVPDSELDVRFSPHLVLAFTTKALLGEWSRPELPVSFVGPVRPDGGADSTIPAQRANSATPLVFVSLGTVNADTGHRFLNACVAAIRARPDIAGLVVDPAKSVRANADNVVVRPYVAQQSALARAAVVVCHAGHNTVCEALSYGLPLVVAPIRDDQSIVAGHVTRVGAGIRLRFEHTGPKTIGAAIDQVLADPSYRDNAASIRASFRAAGGAEKAADLLTELADQHRAEVR